MRKALQKISLLILLISTQIVTKTLIGQEINDPKGVIDELSLNLSGTGSNTYRTFQLYSKAAQELTNRGNYSLADSLFQLAIPLSNLEEDSTKLMEVYASRAFMYKVQGRFTNALEDYLVYLDYFTRKRDFNHLVLAHAYMTEYYRSLEEGGPCRQHVYEGLGLIQNNEVQPEHKAYLYSRMAAYHTQFRADTDSTIYYSNLALQYANEASDNFIAGLSQNELGFIYMNIDRLDTVKNFNYFRSAMRNFLAEKRYRDYLSASENLARNYYIIDMPAQAIPILENAISLAERNRWDTFLDDAYLLLAESYAGMQDFSQFYHYMRKAYFKKIETLSAEHAIEASELTANYEKDIAQQKLLEQQAQTQLAQQQAQDNRRALVITIVLSVIFLIIAIISVQLFFRFRKKNALLRAQQETIRQTNAQLSDALDQKNVLYKELNHRVKNNLTVLSGLVYLQESGEKEASQKEVYETLRQRIQSMAMVHQNLYEFNDALNVNFQDYLGELIPNLASAYSRNNTVEHSIKCEDFSVDINEAVPLAMIINELVTNSFKHAFSNGFQGKIEVWADHKGNERTIHYRDNGPGMPEESSLKNESLGMRLVKLMAAQLKSKLVYKGGTDGAYFRIELAS